MKEKVDKDKAVARLKTKDPNMLHTLWGIYPDVYGIVWEIQFLKGLAKMLLGIRK